MSPEDRALALTVLCPEKACAARRGQACYDLRSKRRHDMMIMQPHTSRLIRAEELKNAVSQEVDRG